jgi:hypothetical protein
MMQLCGDAGVLTREHLSPKMCALDSLTGCRCESSDPVAKGGQLVTQILTAEDFVVGIFAILALRDRKNFTFGETELDARFEEAFEDLVANEAGLNVRPNFTFYVDAMHGDSESVRETVLAARDQGVVALHNPAFNRVTILLDEKRANRYLAKNPMKRGFLEKLVDRHFDGFG